jgi:hypothetical protein
MQAAANDLKAAAAAQVHGGTDFQFRSCTLPNLIKCYQMKALCPIWQVCTLPNATNYCQEQWEANGRRICHDLLNFLYSLVISLFAFSVQ